MTTSTLLMIYFTVALAPNLIDCSRLLLTQGAGAATEIPAGGRSCATVCQTPLLLASFPTTKQPTSYACTAQKLPGFQSGAGATTCTVAEGSRVMETQDYSCLCLAPSQLQGLGKPDTAGSCTGSCPTSAGLLGTPVVAGDSKSVCLAASEAGTTNHFGYTTPAGCTFATTGATVENSNTFSCVCAYGGETPAPSGANITNLLEAEAPSTSLQRPQTQLPTAG